MKYTSTRGGLSGVDFEGVLFAGYAPDGGMFMPEHVPKLDRDTLQLWSSHSYRDLVKEVCSLFISPEAIPRNDLNDLIDKAFLRFRHEDVVPVARLESGLNVLEMWHGATHAFKDLSMSCVGQFLAYFLKMNNRHVNILVVDGTSDELDVPIKKFFEDTDFVRQHSIMSTNSVNWARVMVQIAHFCHGYFQCVPTTAGETLPQVEIVVPTGGAGNMTAGCIAQKMGLPIQLVAGVNRNDIIHRTVQHGDFSLRDTEVTLASAMDIQEPYNMERILWLLSGADSGRIKQMMEEFNVKKRLQLPQELHQKLLGAMTSCSVTDDDILKTIRRCWEENRYLLCPHSAVATFYHYQQFDSGNNKPRCCLAPASAAKFQDVILRANLTPEIPQEIIALMEKETRSIPLSKHDDWEKVLREKIESIGQQRLQKHRQM
ncbi:threonine synthase-like 2 isoform X2 [Pseudophryne corroboree]|uniref:threonine synthase-like 2 isoform X2 n=1 Tax=Pseudophryne corroboree TaxID=495146 RepID=UPI003081CB0D